MSKLDGFYDFLDKTEIGFLDEKTRKEIDSKFEEWGWRWDLPKTESGKKLAILICSYSANWISKNQKETIKKSLEHIDYRFCYLTTGFLVEKGIPFHEFNLIDFNFGETATKNGLKKHWKKKINLDNLWYNICGGSLFSVTWEIFIFWESVGVIIYWLTSFIGIVGFVQYQFGFTSNAFYKFLFDPFTVNILFYQFILFSILNFILYFNDYGFDSEIWSTTISGAFKFLDNAHYSRLIIGFILSSSIAILFIPFHNFLINIAFFLHFFILGVYFWDQTHINFALFNIENIKSIHKFLNEPESNK
jgi:hypothetical protein